MSIYTNKGFFIKPIWFNKNDKPSVNVNNTKMDGYITYNSGFTHITHNQKSW